MTKKKIIVWRWAEPTKRFEPRRNRSWGDLKLKSHNYVVFAGLTPIDWIWLGCARTGVLHKIELTEEQASQCVVAEQNFRPTEKEINKYLERTGKSIVGSLIGYSMEQYEKSFIPLPDYNGEHNLPEVLIPFEVEAKAEMLRTICLKFKIKYLKPELGRFPSLYRSRTRTPKKSINKNKQFIMLILKLIGSLFLIYFIQQIIHELGHGFFILIFRGKIIELNFGIRGASITYEIVAVPWINIFVHLSGGIIASLLLLIIYENTKNMWVEFNTIVLSFIFSNIFTAFIEGFFHKIYVQNLKKWSWFFLLFFVLSVFLLRSKYRENYILPYARV